MIRPKDFASDNLVKALVSFGTIKKMVTAKSDFGSTRDGDKAVLAITLFFMDLQLHSVNGKSTPPNHRVVYLWCSMLWLTSICGTSIVTKRNVVSAVIPLIFIFIRPDVQHSRFCTSEPIEHTFGNNRAICREFTVLNFCQLIEKQMRRLKLMYQHKFCPSRDPKKGYQATYADFFEYSMSAGLKRDSDDNVHMFDDSDFIAKELWDTVRKLISHSNNLMTNLFNVVGVLREELSPFCREFKSAEDLRDEFIKFCPVTFKYNDVAGVEQGQIVEQSNMESKMSNQVILQKIGQFANDMEGTCSGEDSDMSRKICAKNNNTGNDGNEGINDSTSIDTTGHMYNDLMSQFKALLMVKSPTDLLPNVLNVSACLSGGGTVQGALGPERKAKSLFGRWVTKATGVADPTHDSNPNDSVEIKRDTIILVDVKTGRGAATSIVSKHYRVVTIYDKYYNKWLIAKESVKKWKEESTTFKLGIRMLNKDILDEYSDVELVDHDLYKRHDVYRTINDSNIVGVVGKLEIA